MFSPALQEGGPAKGTRSSRRRQRPLSSDATVQQPKAKRQRVPLSETTFVSPDAPPEMYEVKSDKVDLLSIKRDGIENIGAPRKELSVRSKKPKPGERTNKGDGSIVLTQNNAYTVSKLPALPDRLRADAQNRQHGAVYSSTGYGLTLTHTHAFVWPYTSTAASPETFTFTLPYPSKHASDPLPLGSLVSPSASSEEPGLVIVMPVSGKIAYWESISSAATLDFIRQQRSGVEDTISGMFSGEHVIQIVNAESAGFVLGFSSGRLAYMNVRDTHGRPGISVQFLRNGLNTSAGGFLGSIRHALSSSTIRGDVAAARANHGSVVGERAVVAVTTKGRLSCWKVHRSGHHDLLADVDVRDELIRNIQQADPAANTSPQDSFEVIDFTFVPRGLDRKYVDMNRLSQAISQGQDSLQHLLLLIAFAGKRQSRYSLVEAVISAEGAKIGMVRPLTSYTSPVRLAAAEKPRIYLPRPALVAFVVFDRALVVASMASPPDSPDSQLQEDSHIIPATFEDVIDFRDEGTIQIVGSGIEEPSPGGPSPDDLRAHRYRTKNPTAVLLLQGVGTVRVAITDVDRFASEKPPEVTAKSKLEQAVFFGIKHDNPVVFQGRRDLPFSSQDVGNAAIELSHEIVSSKTPFIANLPASLENNMKTRMSYLDRLIAHLNAVGVSLDSRTRWILLYNAEKMGVATWIWQKNEQFLAQRADGDKKNLISETAVYINEHQKTEPNPAIGEVDPVRHWFINDVWRLDIFVAWGYQIIKYAWTERLTDEEGINRLVWEAVTINNGALHEAYQYRLNNWRLYGVDPKNIAGGNAIPEPWTSTHFIANNLKRLVEFCHQWLDTYYLPSPEQPPVNGTLLEYIRDTLPSLTNRYFTALSEYSRWASQSDDAQAQELGKTYRQKYLEDRYSKILKLKDYGLWDEAIELAKEHEAFDSLAEVVVQQILSLEQDALAADTTSSEAEKALSLVDAKRRRMGVLFEDYKEKFAFHAYEVLLESSGVQAVLEFPYDRMGYATSFLRTKPELAKISWINDVEREKDIDHAAETLLNLGLTREQQVWSKKIELSLGKLALMAEAGPDPSTRGGGSINGQSDSEARNEANLEKIDQELAIIKIQDDLYGQIYYTVQEAVDEAAELELAMKEHGALIPNKQKALAQVFEDGMTRLLKHEALQPLTLIDLLTLAYLDPKHFNAIGDQFYLALNVARYGLKGEDRANAERLIWRRCFIRDDWRQVNETNDKNDADQLSAIGGTALYHTLFAIIDEQHEDEHFRPYVRPSDALGVFTESLDRRFDDMDESFRAKLMDAMKAEDTRLRAFVDKAQLESWYRGTRDCAETTVTAAYNRLTKAAEEKKKRTSNGNGNGNGKLLFERTGLLSKSKLFVGRG
ncbi:Non-repetitive/WGA-negative nucleoporin C-terminal-domain-containing protein [Lasiosphaeria hispida]|uniref:Non-repetitive/WGA-negative nucleoporin C-terminal-domain-containing protein n=1 Tax=Lasiosphaeria hispida TaxID=260671 RepID=A0AAJ0MD42_9PEZI|nr:Non-repetitive/WGA-negative nucleoporin C-terminal-domain-containing protein [Lasiosphaeria hispida]